jgi:hypothetical protein
VFVKSFVSSMFFKYRNMATPPTSGLIISEESETNLYYGISRIVGTISNFRPLGLDFLLA